MDVLIGCRDGEAFVWNPVGETAVNPHVLIVGTSGAGKTQVTKTIIHQLLEEGVPTLVFDLQSEYGDVEVGRRYLVDFSMGRVRVNPLDPLGLRPDVVAYEVTNIIDKIYRQLGDIQKAILTEAILEAFRRKGYKLDEPAHPRLSPPSMDDVRAVLEEFAEGERSTAESRPVRHLLARLWPIFQFKLFSGDSGLSISSILKPGTLTIVDLNTLPARSENLSAITTIFIVNKLWNHLKSLGPIKEPSLRLAIVLDEAHQYAFEESPVEKILREGRKFGASAILASQIFSDFSEAVVGNTALKIFLRIDTLKDRKTVSQLLKIPLKDLELGKFEAIISLSGEVARVRVAPYFEYRKGEFCTIKRAKKRTEKAPERMVAVDVPLPKDAGEGEVEKQVEEVTGEVGMEEHGTQTTVVRMVRERCQTLVDAECAALVDSIIQLIDCPSTAEGVDYYCRQDIEENLKSRYPSGVVDRVLKEVDSFLEEAAEARGVNLKILLKLFIMGKREVKSELVGCDCYGAYVRRVKNIIASLDEREQALVYLTRGLIKGCEYEYDSKSKYSERLWDLTHRIRTLSGIETTPGEIIGLNVKTGLANKLSWVTTSGYTHKCYVPVEGLEFIMNYIVESNRILGRVSEEVRKALVEAYEDWDTRRLSKIYRAYFGDREFRLPREEYATPIYKYQAIIDSLIDDNGELVFPSLKDSLAETALRLHSFLGELRVVFEEAIKVLAKEIHGIKVRELHSEHKNIVCYRVAQNSKRMNVCLNLLPTISHLPLVRQYVIVAPLMEESDVCHMVNGLRGVLIVTPKEVRRCGVFDGTSLMFAETLESLLGERVLGGEKK